MTLLLLVDYMFVIFLMNNILEQQLSSS